MQSNGYSTGQDDASAERPKKLMSYTCLPREEDIESMERQKTLERQLQKSRSELMHLKQREETLKAAAEETYRAVVDCAAPEARAAPRHVAATAKPPPNAQSVMQQCEALKAEVMQRCQEIATPRASTQVPAHIQKRDDPNPGMLYGAFEAAFEALGAPSAKPLSLPIGEASRGGSFGTSSPEENSLYPSSSTTVSSPQVAEYNPPKATQAFAECMPTQATKTTKPVSEDGSQGSSERPLRSNQSYTSEQWKAYQELEQEELRCEHRRLELALNEERSRSNQLQKIFASELMAQKDAHARDVAALEDMVAKVLAENKNLSGMVEQLCGQVQTEEQASFKVTRPSSQDGAAETKQEATHALSSYVQKDTIKNQFGSEAETATVSEHHLSSSSDDASADMKLFTFRELGRESFAYVNVD